MKARPHERLIVWQESRNLMKMVYRLTSNFPAEERFGLTDQMRRAAKSIPVNIAEGNMRRTKKDKQHYLTICQGSTEELHVHGTQAYDLEFLSNDDFEKFHDQICRTSYLLHRLRSSIQ